MQVNQVSQPQKKVLSTRGFPKWAVEGDIKGWYEILSYFTSRKEAREFRQEIIRDGYANKAHVRRVEVSIVA